MWDTKSNKTKFLSEEQETELYQFVDLDEQFNECSEYYEEIETNVLEEVLA